jgi:hypothetical protein
MSNVKVLEVDSQMAFDFVANILNDNGIGCYRLGADLGGLHAALSIFGKIELHVEEEFKDQALEIISLLDL